MPGDHNDVCALDEHILLRRHQPLAKPVGEWDYDSQVSCRNSRKWPMWPPVSGTGAPAATDKHNRPRAVVCRHILM
jgi:hypothetical protein